MKFKRSPRHYKEDRFDTKRAVLSYEQLPLDDYDQQSKPEKDKENKLSGKKIALVIGILAVLIVAVFFVLNRFSLPGCANVSPISSEFPVTLKGSLISNGNFDTYDGGYSYVSDTHYVVYDNSGVEKFSSQVAFNKPILKLNYNGSAIVYDLGATNYSVYSDSELLFSGETDTNMYLADVTPEFAYATVTESRDYKAKLSVYDAQGNPLYGYSFEEYYITSMCLSPDATGAVACGITAENGIEKSVIYVFDFTESKPIAFYELASDVVFDCDYLSSNSVCVIGESASYVLSGRNFDKITKNAYSQMVLTSYDINPDTGMFTVSLSRSGDGRNCTLQNINDSGKVESKIETDLKCSYVTLYKNRIAVSDSDKVYLYTQTGELISDAEVNSDSKQIRLISADTTLVLGLKEINATKF